jgi:cell division protein FtsW
VGSREQAARKVGPKGKQLPPALVEARRRREATRKVATTEPPALATSRLKTISASKTKERVATRAKAQRLTGTGYAILGVTMIMFLYGMIMIFSASSGLAFQVHGSSYYYLVRQAIWFAVGIVAMIALAFTDYHSVAEASWLLVLLSLAALAAVPFIATEVYGSKRAISYGPFVFQPSEMAKMSLLIFAAYIYNKRRGKLDDWRQIAMPVLAATSLACLLIIIEPDLGSMLIVALAVFAVLFLAGAPLRRLAVLAGSGAVMTAIFIFSSHYRKARFLAFLDPWSAPREGGFHIIQSMVALGSGSLKGLGLGMSRQKFFYLPNAHTDFIFSIIGEELGIIGTLAVLGLFVAFVCLGFRIARGAPDGLGRLLAMGITVLIGIQAFVNMGAATGGLPITGVTLPFFSYGGSSLVICMCLIGILINVSRQEVGRPMPKDGRKKRESGDMRRRNRRPSPPPARAGRGARGA